MEINAELQISEILKLTCEQTLTQTDTTYYDAKSFTQETIVRGLPILQQRKNTTRNVEKKFESSCKMKNIIFGFALGRNKMS